MVEFLKRNIDVFVWNACDALGIDLAFIYHYLNANLSITPKKQPPRRPSREHADAIKNEVMKLKRVGAIKEVFLPRMVGQHHGSQEEKWRMVSLCRLHEPKQSLPKGPIPHALDRPAGGRNNGPSSDEFPGCLSGLSSNTAGPGGLGEDSLYDAY